jgi:putative Mn2+ efflux pump MntP
MPVNSAATQSPLNGTSNQLALIAPIQSILIATFDIAVRDTTAVGATVFVGQRQVMYSVSAAGALTMLSAASGATVGTDVNNITATYFTPATGIVFGVDNTNASFPILSLTIGNTAVTGVHALSAVANVHYSFVGI